MHSLIVLPSKSWKLCQGEVLMIADSCHACVHRSRELQQAHHWCCPSRITERLQASRYISSLWDAQCPSVRSDNRASLDRRIFAKSWATLATTQITQIGILLSACLSREVCEYNNKQRWILLNILWQNGRHLQRRVWKTLYSWGPQTWPDDAGEAQKIDRIMEKFAERYCRDNEGTFSSADGPYLLAFALIMLNTDAHNPRADKKLSCEDFVTMCQAQVSLQIMGQSVFYYTQRWLGVINSCMQSWSVLPESSAKGIIFQRGPILSAPGLLTAMR